MEKTRIRDLEAEVKALRIRLDEAEETLRAIRNHEIDALVVNGPDGGQVFTLQGAEHPYRVLVETMNEGAATVATDGTILYCNSRLSELTGMPLNKLLGASFHDFVMSRNRQSLEAMLRACGKEGCKGDFLLRTADGGEVPVSLSARSLMLNDAEAFCIVATDLTERKRAEDELQKAHDDLEAKVEQRTRELKDSEQRYRSLYENSLEGIMFTNPDGTVLSANRRMHEMLDMTEEEILAARRADIVVHDEKLLVALEERARTGKFQEELTFRRKDGSLFPAEVSNTVFEDSSGTLRTSLVVRDITERKQAEERLQEAKARLDLALQSASMGVWHWDLLADRRSFDDQVCSLLGIEPTTFTGTADEFFGVVHPDDREMLKAAHARTIEQDVPYEPEYRAIWPDGSVHYIAARGRLVRHDASNRPERINGIIWDITERKWAEEEIRQQRDFVSTVLDTAGALVVVLDRQGRITRFNRACEEITGYSAAEVLGRVFWEFLVSQDEMPGVRETWEALKAGAFPNTHENHWLARDGSHRLIAWSNTALASQANELLYIIATGVDITERKQAEEALRQRAEEFQRLLDMVPQRSGSLAIQSVLPLPATGGPTNSMRRAAGKMCRPPPSPMSGDSSTPMDENSPPANYQCKWPLPPTRRCAIVSCA
ncbi:MAG: PAS domain S-box protein [Syntrophorhabdales bacterium]|jgi:PAS domain S-box-containing protein